MKLPVSPLCIAGEMTHCECNTINTIPDSAMDPLDYIALFYTCICIYVMHMHASLNDFPNLYLFQVKEYFHKAGIHSTTIQLEYGTELQR